MNIRRQVFLRIRDGSCDENCIEEKKTEKSEEICQGEA
jgi:hypothetical protein